MPAITSMGVYLGDSASLSDVPLTVGGMMTLMMARLASFDVAGDDFRRDRWVFATKDILKLDAYLW